MVWINGGGFSVGSGTERLYHGKHLAAKLVVLVTFNYRLGGRDRQWRDALDGQDLGQSGNEDRGSQGV